MPERANACATVSTKGEASRQQVYLELRRAIEQGIFAAGTRGSSITFAQRKQGDVFISWENEAYLLEKELATRWTLYTPPISILAQPAVTVVDKNVDKKAPAPWPRNTSNTCTRKRRKTSLASISTAPPAPTTPTARCAQRACMPVHGGASLCARKTQGTST